MNTELSITLRPDEEENHAVIRRKIMEQLAKKNIIAQKDNIVSVVEKKSIDARHGTVKILLKCRVYVNERPHETGGTLPAWRRADKSKRVVIVGTGPAGLFAALRLLEDGITPILIERGPAAERRVMDIAALRADGILDAHSNYCFGEGGAGTFSDGKLYTRSQKRGDIGKIHRIFVAFGASEAILTDSHPHIGTDKLPSIVAAMRNKIISLGGTFLFDSLCTDMILERTASEKKPRARGVRITNVRTGERSEVLGESVVLATGHSAVDVYRMISRIAPSALEAKTFAVGVRVEHPRALIDSIQFHGKPMARSAEYRLATQEDGRGVYSFCMCPGGHVVPCATAEHQIVVNGMSASGRDSRWSNAAIVVETRPEDIPEPFWAQARADGCAPLAGLLWRTWLEEETFRHADGQKAPAQLLTDFLNHRRSQTLPESSYRPGLRASRLDLWLPAEISSRLHGAFRTFDKTLRGFADGDALLIASETRTSTPVRIVRDKATLECTEIAGLYPCGEGSGYSGGIGSSAMDGERAAEKICGTF